MIPDRSLDAITASGKIVAGVRVREITLGLTAVLERIRSPLVSPMREGKQITLRELLPTMYVMTRPAVDSELLLAEGIEALVAAAIEWGDGYTTAEGLDIAQACAAAAKRLARTMPSGDGGAEGNAQSPATAG